MKIVSWNVNGLRAILRKNFLSFLTTWQAEMVCLQETKTNRDLPLNLANYQEFWEHGQRPGYSGTLILLKKNLAQRVVRRQPGKFLTAVADRKSVV